MAEQGLWSSIITTAGQLGSGAANVAVSNQQLKAEKERSNQEMTRGLLDVIALREQNKGQSSKSKGQIALIIGIVIIVVIAIIVGIVLYRRRKG